MTRGLIIAAPASGSGKTTITLGVLRALHRRGHRVHGAKSGPDYIDPRFHAAACQASCLNLDAWAMTPARVKSLIPNSGLLIIEGAMGLFDGAPSDGKGATADLARILDLPVVLVVDAARMSQSIAPLVAGFVRHDPAVRIAGVILNNVGSTRHEQMLRHALAPINIPVLGAIPRATDLHHPSRHLGLVQAAEHPELEFYLNRVADSVAGTIDLQTLTDLASPLPTSAGSAPFPPPAQSIAIARDQAFAFTYPHLLADWQNAGASLSFFSPLNDEVPAPAALIILPGGYPELHAETLAQAGNFRTAMQKAALDTAIYGECGGYMVLGDSLTDAQGESHQMLGLLSLETSFANRKLHLGYRHLTALGGPFSGTLTGHEFHYSTTLRADGQPLFKSTDSQGNSLPDMGLINGNVSGSYAHIIDRCV